MYDVSCKLLSYNYELDSIGNEIIKTQEKEIPIIKLENIWQSEFFSANEQGLKPSLKLRISALNYDNEQELIYMDKEYTVIKADQKNYSEVILLCERKAKNG